MIYNFALTAGGKWEDRDTEKGEWVEIYSPTRANKFLNTFHSLIIFSFCYYIDTIMWRTAERTLESALGVDGSSEQWSMPMLIRTATDFFLESCG